MRGPKHLTFDCIEWMDFDQCLLVFETIIQCQRKHAPAVHIFILIFVFMHATMHQDQRANVFNALCIQLDVIPMETALLLSFAVMVPSLNELTSFS